MTFRESLRPVPGTDPEIIEDINRGMAELPFADKEIGEITIAEIRKGGEILEIDPLDLCNALLYRRCRVCGCTDDDCSQCVEKTGEACHWVEEDLCSACQTPKIIAP